MPGDWMPPDSTGLLPLLGLSRGFSIMAARSTFMAYA
jgi:hypothetical protein